MSEEEVEAPQQALVKVRWSTACRVVAILILVLSIQKFQQLSNTTAELQHSKAELKTAASNEISATPHHTTTPLRTTAYVLVLTRQNSFTKVALPTARRMRTGKLWGGVTCVP